MSFSYMLVFADLGPLNLGMWRKCGDGDSVGDGAGQQKYWNASELWYRCARLKGWHYVVSKVEGNENVQ
jgi:hypothetical protein